MKGPTLYKSAKHLIPGGTQLLSKRPEMFAPDVWPSYFKRAKGARVWDLDDREFTDMSIMAVGACILGYADDEVDNAVIESWHSTLEFELRMLEHFETKAQARHELVAWIEDYNADRRHSALNMRSPLQHEQQLRDGGSAPGQAS